jgi:hypothetical protein
LWSIHAVVIDLLRAALTPRIFALADLLRARREIGRSLAEAKRKRRRQRIFPAKTLS